MAIGNEATPTRVDRRKAATRAALIGAAQKLLAEGRQNVPVLEITTAADVGMGSFYNHFSSKEELFEAAVLAALDAHGAMMDAYCADLDDPAEAFTQSFRLTGRMHRRLPELSLAILRAGGGLAYAERGLAERARRDIGAAAAAGRFDVADLDVAMIGVVGSVVALGQFLHDHPDRDDAVITDAVTRTLLRGFGMSAADAEQRCDRSLPDPA